MVSGTGAKMYHFTCGHGARKIGRYGILAPHPHPFIGQRLVWFTDLPEPTRDQVGLSSTFLTCDRMSYRYHATDLETIVPWTTSPGRRDTHPEVVRAMEAFGEPEHWFISTTAVPVILDRGIA